MFDLIAAFATAVESSTLAQTLKFSRWGYALANTGHVLGIALLVGSILPLDLRLLGVWGQTDRASLVRVLVPMAATGLVLAVMSGMLLFTVRAEDYVQVVLLYAKLCLIITGTTLALLLHLRAGLWVERASDRQLAFHGAASLLCWLGALVCGRMIAYFPVI
ncbi:MAG: hypothetical protein AAF367_18660 [Pseudomonadota bacterium]